MLANRTPFEQAAVFLSLNNPRRAAEIMLQIIMEQEGRITELEKREPERDVGNQVMDISGITELLPERNFTDGLDEPY